MIYSRQHTAEGQVRACCARPAAQISLVQHAAHPLLQSTPKCTLTFNPLVQAHAKGSSLMQPLRPQAAQPSLGALGSVAFAALAAADVAPEADFFQKYQARP